MERFCSVAGMTIAIMTAASACVPLESTSPDIPASQPALPGAVTCDGPFGKDASHASVVAKFGAANVALEEASLGFEDFRDIATILANRNGLPDRSCGWD